MKREKNPLEKLVIIDNFYSDADIIRNRALERDYQEPDANTVQLARTIACTKSETMELYEKIKPYIKEINNFVQINILYRYLLAETRKKVFCHVDGCSYAGIIYLTLPEHCAGGTTIYRHKKTGDTIFNRENAHLYHFNDENDWEVLREVEMVYNRLVIYPGQHFHAITPVFFGDKIENSRLTQNIFLYKADDPAWVNRHRNAT